MPSYGIPSARSMAAGHSCRGALAVLPVMAINESFEEGKRELTSV